jgi:hypothetical protein
MYVKHCGKTRISSWFSWVLTSDPRDYTSPKLLCLKGLIIEVRKQIHYRNVIREGVGTLM